MNTDAKQKIARIVKRYLANLAIENPTFKEFDQAWYELNQTKNIDYPEISLRVARDIYKLTK